MLRRLSRLYPILCLAGLLLYVPSPLVAEPTLEKTVSPEHHNAPSTFTLPASIPVKRNAPSGDSSNDSALVVIALLAALALLAYPVAKAWQQRKAGNAWVNWFGASPASDLRVLGSTRLTPRHSLHVVEWEGKRLLLGCSEQSVRVLDQADAPLPRTSEANE